MQKTEPYIKIIQEFKIISDCFNNLTELSFEISDTDKQKAFRKSIAEMYAKMYTDIIMPIEYEFPELRLDKD